MMYLCGRISKQKNMAKQTFYIIVIVVLVIICTVDFVRINNLQGEVERTREMIQEATDAMDYKLDASIYKKDAQLYLMNLQYNNPQTHKLLADSCRNDCVKYRQKYGKEEKE